MQFLNILTPGVSIGCLGVHTQCLNSICYTEGGGVGRGESHVQNNEFVWFTKKISAGRKYFDLKTWRWKRHKTVDLKNICK